ncbi:hypothetical protein QBZ16_000925 [Prototheca wickerhamii]|uniref:Uncharacterized protein n=1 Tax=Prototheca wickerhamii TaxID=3111 RepID=A0AAD9IGW4_PROWI|nr:hypothetical protein QBZ16_000925 [Prototheca wickerhamii]
MAEGEAGLSHEELTQAVQSTWRDASRVLIFTKEAVLYSSFESSVDERLALADLYRSREDAITNGTSTGLGLVREEASVYGTPTFTLITYEMPHLSARMVQMLTDFSTKYLAVDEGL